MLVDGLEIALKRSILHTSLIFHKFHILVIDKSTVNRYQSSAFLRNYILSNHNIQIA